MPKISELTAGTTVDGTEKIPALQNGVTVYLTQAQLAALTSVQDSNFTLTDDIDTTKRARFQLSGIATATTRTYTLPDVTDTLVTLGATQTLTGKTLTGPVISTISNTGTLTLPTSTDTLVGRNTTDTLTNKTLGNTNTVTLKDTLFTLQDDGDTSKQAMWQLSGITTATTRTFTLPDANTTVVGTDATQALTNKTYEKVTITAPATSATLTLIDGTTLTGPAASGTAMTLGNVETVTGAKTFGSAGAVGKLAVAGTTSGSTIVNATAVASGTLTLPAATDTLVGKATTDTLTNKTFDSAGTGNTLQVSSVTVSRGQFPGESTTGSATAGNIGEYIESVIASGSATSLTTATPKTVTSISLTAGDWDVSGNVSLIGTATTSFTFMQISISTTNNTQDITNGRASVFSMAAVVPGAGTDFAIPVQPVRMSLSGTTTIYIVANVTFSASTCTAYGLIRARRVR